METALPAFPRASRIPGRGVVIAIAVFKMLHGFLMILLAVTALVLTRPGSIPLVLTWVDALDVGPYRRHIGGLIANGLLRLNVQTLVALAFGAGIYATVFFVEAAGLLLNKLWAEWMVVVSTSLLIPLEITEIVRHPGRVLVPLTFAVNVAILIYLIVHVRHHIRARQSQMNSTGASTSG
jgi:uncharacterized membrane protein (DUF2068 family)